MSDHFAIKNPVQTQWKITDLDGKIVEFALLTEDGMVAEGAGYLMMRQNEAGEQEISIRSPRTDLDSKQPAEDFLHTLDQREADLIEKAPKEAECDFLCIDDLLFLEE